MLTETRSIAIDNLEDQGINVVYVYFDYKSRHTQTTTAIIANLVKQLVSRLGTIPTEVVSLYDQYACDGNRPD